MSSWRMAFGASCYEKSHLRALRVFVVYFGPRMTIGMLSATLFGDMFGTAAMRAAFGELAFLMRCAAVEAALARAQARVGIVPGEAAAAISASVAALAANPEALDLDRLKRETETVGYPILPLVRQLGERA